MDQISNALSFRLALAIWLYGSAAAFAQQRPGRGAEPHGLKQFDVVMEELLREFKIVGGSLAIAKEGRLAVARGYGSADVANKKPVSPSDLFCIASVSKSISAVAALKLAEQGKLDLDARLIDVLGDLKPLGGLGDLRARQIKVRHLLYHAAGWDVKKSGQPPEALRGSLKLYGLEWPITSEQAFQIVLSRPLDFAPGTESHYSNFGFVVLRLVIQQASGEEYEKFVRDKILKPMGIKRMQLEPAAPQIGEGEVKRYRTGGVEEAKSGHKNNWRGGGNPGGNWLASGADMARFLTALDGSRGKPFLSPKTISLMLAPPPPPFHKAFKPGVQHVGLGWDVVRKEDRGVNYGKNGAKAGVFAWIEHTSDGIDWVLLLNTNPTKDEEETNHGGSLLNTARVKIHDALGRVNAWPKHDLFDEIP